jgi:hypothetical protein
MPCTRQYSSVAPLGLEWQSPANGAFGLHLTSRHSVRLSENLKCTGKFRPWWWPRLCFLSLTYARGRLTVPPLRAVISAPRLTPNDGEMLNESEGRVFGTMTGKWRWIRRPRPTASAHSRFPPGPNAAPTDASRFLLGRLFRERPYADLRACVARLQHLRPKTKRAPRPKPKRPCRPPPR